MDKPKLCEKCNGTGEITGPFSDYEIWDCEQCNGTGLKLKTRRAIKLVGLGSELELSKVTVIKTDKEMIHLDKLNDGTWRLIYNEKTIPDITQLKSFLIVREG